MGESEKIVNDLMHKKDLERIKKFRLLDDDFMSKCFEDNIECTKLVLDIILERGDLQIQSVHTQYSVKNLQGRSVRLDIMAIDDVGKRYNIEVQRADKGAGAKRARYNSSILDANILRTGEEFSELPETYVIFITENDVLGAGLPIYHIERTIKETGILFGDDSHILYVNAECKADTPLGRLMEDFSCTDPSDMTYKMLADRVRYFKEDKEGITVMCKAMEDMRNEAAEMAAKQANKAAASRMIKDGVLSLEKIAEYSGLSLDDVRALAG